MSSPIVILGMQRSGTSALSGALWRLGLWFGKEELLYAADANNKLGYFEHRAVTSINLNILDEFWMHVTSFGRLPDNWTEFPQSIKLRRLLIEFLHEEFYGRERWGIKQPLTSLVLPVYNEVLSEMGLTPHYVVCVRNPLESMASESMLEFGDSYRVMQSLGPMAVGSWLRYTLGSICDSLPNKLTVVPYEDLLKEPRRVLEAIVSEHPSWRPSEEQWGLAVSSIRSDLRHQRRKPEELDAFPPMVRQVYEAAMGLARKGDPKELERLQELYQEFEVLASMFGEAPPRPGVLSLVLEVDAPKRVGGIQYPVEGKWQTLRVPVEAPQDTELWGMIYGLPARVWVRRCQWISSAGETEVELKPAGATMCSGSDGVWRYDVVFQTKQVKLRTPAVPGPYTLEIELLVETGPAVHLAACTRMSRQLQGN